MEYQINEARYAKGEMVITPKDSVNGYMGRASRLAMAIGGRWVHRSHGFVVSKAAAAKFERLFAAGYDGSAWDRSIIEPTRSSMTDTTAPARIAAMRQRRKDAGLVRIESWVPAAIRIDVEAVIKAMCAAALEKPEKPG